MSTLIDRTGQKFDRLKVIARAKNNKQHKAQWHCLCDCGNKSIVCASALHSGATRSCGCLNKEKKKIRFTTHGLRHSSEYKSWDNMRSRCKYKNHVSYKYYGGRGIKVCKRWLVSFENFIADMGMKPTPKHSIDRIDNDDNYRPENCRWATHTQQMQNRGTTKK